MIPPRRIPGGMVQKIIDVVGVSPESFAAAAENAVKVAAESVHDIKWARVGDLEMELEGGIVKNYRATVHIYFDVKR